MESKFVIREARVGDEVAIMSLIRDLAEYEREPDAVINTSEQLKIDLFEDHICSAIVAEMDGEIQGFALYYTSYSTWRGRCLYLEDFYVKPECRRTGMGSKLFERIIEIAKEQKVKRMDWQVLDWNQLAIDFYRKFDAKLEAEWLNGRFYFD